MTTIMASMTLVITITIIIATIMTQATGMTTASTTTITTTATTATMTTQTATTAMVMTIIATTTMATIMTTMTITPTIVPTIIMDMTTRTDTFTTRTVMAIRISILHSLEVRTGTIGMRLMARVRMTSGQVISTTSLTLTTIATIKKQSGPLILKALHSGIKLVNFSHRRTNSMRWRTILTGSPGQKWIPISGNGSGSGLLNLTTLGRSTTSLASCKPTLTTSGSGFRIIQVDITRLMINSKLIEMTQSSGIGTHGTNSGTITMQLSLLRMVSCTIWINSKKS